MNELLTDLKGTFTSVDYYKNILQFSFARSLKLFIFYFTVFAFITAAILTFTVYLPLNVSIAKLPATVKDMYPKQLEVTINKGIVHTNVQQPYMIPLGKMKSTFGNSKITNLLVIDTNADIGDLSKYNTIALLTRSHLSYYKDEGKIETVSLNNINSLTINKGIVNDFINKVAPILKIVIPFLIIATFLGVLIGYAIFKMIYLLWIALLVMLLSKLTSLNLNYGKAYQLSLHFALIITTLTAILTIANIHLIIPFLTTLLYMLVGFIVLNRIKESTKVAPRKKMTT